MAECLEGGGKGALLRQLAVPRDEQLRTAYVGQV